MLAACAPAPEQLPRSETLYIAGLQWQAPTNFNPLNGNPDWPGIGNHLLTYETLFAFNQLTGNLDPLLAKELKVVDPTTALSSITSPRSPPPVITRCRSS